MRALWILLGVWAVIVVWSIASSLTMIPEGDGFTRGINRAVNFGIWQIFAAIIALVLVIRARREAVSGTLGWLFHVPMMLAILLGFAILAVTAAGVIG